MSIHFQVTENQAEEFQYFVAGIFPEEERNFFDLMDIFA